MKAPLNLDGLDVHERGEEIDAWYTAVNELGEGSPVLALFAALIDRGSHRWADVEVLLHHFDVDGFYQAHVAQQVDMLGALVDEATEHARDEARDRNAWEEAPGHPVADWQYEVANGDTRAGYLEWVAARQEQSA